MKKFLPAFLLLLASSAIAQEREWIPYKKFVESLKLDKYYSLPAAQRDKIDLSLKIMPQNKAIKPADIGLAVVHSGGRTPLPLDAEGRMHVVPNPKWLAEDAKIMTTMPTGEKARMAYILNALVPAGTQWPYATLMGSVEQSNEAIGKVAGAFSLFAPKMKWIVLKFDQPAKVTVQARAGALQYATDAKHQIRLKPDNALLKENPLMVATARPLEAELMEDE